MQPTVSQLSSQIDAERDPTEIFKDVEACLNVLQAAA
jgi:hypothetical protein